ncbi:MAG: MFS transporter [Candidatus Thermoplasmatota archaeon]|nr:MFS transporter [Candidatus Thermoplasmatota archaeon]
MSRSRKHSVLLILTLLLTALLPGEIVPVDLQQETPPAWPEGSNAYDNMVSMADFGYRQIDSTANINARNWIASELESMGYEVERQPFTSEVCNNCENIVVTINGTLEDDWRVVGAHHDAICYTTIPAGLTYPGCTNTGAYDDGTGSGALLELARTFAEWDGTPLHTWKLGWWDYEEWQGANSPEGGGKGSLHFVENIPDDVNVTYLNLDMFALNWPVPTPLASQLSGCDEEFWTLYMFTSPVEDWSYYENEGLDVTDEMITNAEWFQGHLEEINANLSHPEEWVRVIDDTKGNSDHYNFIMHNHTATWLRGQHQYIHEEGDTCEQTPKHSQTDSVTTVNTLAGGRANVEAGLQTGLDVVATMAWWDWNSTTSETDGEGGEKAVEGMGQISMFFFLPWLIGLLCLVGFITVRRDQFQLGFIIEEEAIDHKPETVTLTSGNSLVESYRSRVITLCVLYIAQGIPWGFITVTFVTFLAVEGVSAGMIADLLLVGTLPWTFKFLWGPVIDRFQYRPMGRRRPWILFAEAGMILTLSLILFIPDPSSNFTAVVGVFLVYNIFTSLQDVSTDALAVDILRSDEFEKVNSYMFSSKLVGGMIGGAGLGTIIGFVGIKGAILLQIPILLLIMMAPLLMTERPGDIRFPWSKSKREIWSEEEEEERNFFQILSNIRTAFSLRSAQLGIVLSLSKSLSFFLIPILPILFVQELGWSEEGFNATKGGLLVLILMSGYIVGGQLGKIFGGKAIIIYSTLAMAMISIFWASTESLWENRIFLVSIWSIHTFCQGMAYINIFSLMMKITWPEVGGTQFTAYMAMMNLSAVIGYSLTEPFAKRFDYSSMILLGAVLESIIILCVMFIDPDETRRVLGTGTTEKS